MSVKEAAPDPGQFEMFGVGTTHFDGGTAKHLTDPAEPPLPEVPPKELPPAPSNDVTEHALHIIAALRYLGKANQRAGMRAAIEVPAYEHDLQKRYKESLPDVVRGAEFNEKGNKNSYRARAKEEFRLALQGSGEIDPESPEFDSDYREFYRKYASPSAKDDRKELKKKLEKRFKIDTSKAPQPTNETMHYESKDFAEVLPTEPQPFHELTPTRPTVVTRPKQTKTPEAQTPTADGQLEISFPKLTTRQKLEALRDDPRAGFLPASHNEKNKALELLDYLDNYQYPAGASQRLQEVFNRQKKDDKRMGRQGTFTAERSVTSLVYEWGDYFTQASNQAIDLLELNMQLHDVTDGGLKLVDAIGDEHVAYPALVRFMDNLRLREIGQTAADFDSLTTGYNREIAQGYNNKNKTVEDPYTAKRPKPEVVDWIKAEIANLTVADVRDVVQAAMHNEIKRAEFWKQRLIDIYPIGMPEAWDASRKVLHDNGVRTAARIMS